MIGRHQMMFGLMIFNFMVFPLVASTFTMPNVINPISDLTPLFGGTATATGTGAGTGQGPTGDTISPQQQASGSCIAGGLVGTAVAGAALVGIGVATGGIGIIPALALLGLGGFGGCVGTAAFIPAGGSQLFNNLVNTTGPFGAFLQALSVALTWVGPMIKFFGDSMGYELNLLVSAPEIGIFLLPFQIAAAVMFALFAAEYIRGTGSTG